MPDKQDKAASPGTRLSPLLVIFAVVAMLAGLAVVLAKPLLKAWVRRDLGAAEIARLDSIQRDPFHFPADWQNVKIPSRDLKMRLAEWKKEFERFHSTVRPNFYDDAFVNARALARHGLRIPEDMWTTFTLCTTASVSLRAAAHAAITTPAWDLELANDEIQAWAGIITGYTNCIAALCENRTGNTSAAMELATRLLPMSMRHPASEPAVHFSALLQQKEVFQLVSSLVNATSSPTELQSLLENLNAFDVHVSRNLKSWQDGLFYIGYLRKAARQGWKVDLKPGAPLAHYFRQHVETVYNLSRHKMSMLTPGTAEYRDWQLHPRDFWLRGDSMLDLDERQVRLALIWAPDWTMIDLQDHGDLSGMESETRAWYDLLRLQIIGRMLDLAGEERTPAQFESRLKVPVDPYSGTAYRWDKDTRQYYSVGPDKKDDLLKLHFVRKADESYDSNSGDISVPGPPPIPVPITPPPSPAEVI